MQFDYRRHQPMVFGKQSKNLQQLIHELDRNSQHGKNQPNIDFSNFGSVQNDQPQEKSFTSELFNKPKQQSIPQSKQKPQFQFQNDTSRDIGQISYIYGGQESFKFQRSMSFQQPESRQSQRFNRLKSLLTKAKKNNLDAFYRNIQQTTNENNQGNMVFNNKNQFKEYTRNMRAEKRQEQAKFQVKMEQKKQKIKNFSKNDFRANLFGNQAAQAFKKKNQAFEGFNILPPEYAQQEQPDEQIDFFKFENNNNHQQKTQQDDKYSQKRDSFFKQAEQFFGQPSGIKQNQRPATTKNSKSSKVALDPIRQQKHTMLDHSLQQRKFQQLIQNYSHMKNNYKTLMQQLKQTSQGQYKLMNQMQKIKHDYNGHVVQNNKNSQVKVQEKNKKKQQKQKIKHIKEQQLAQIKNQIHQIKNSTNQKDLAYVKINQKIQQLEHIVRAALEEVQEEKVNKNFQPKVINYFSTPYQENQVSPAGNSPQKEEFSQGPCLSQTSQHHYEVDNSRSRKQFASTGGIPKPKNQRQNTQKPSSKHHSKVPSNLQSHVTSIKRQYNQKSGYVQKNSIRDQLNFIDQFSSPLQLDLSAVDYLNDQKNQSGQQFYEIPFIPADHALEYIPLKLDQTESKNLRSILTQKSSILYESFQFLITVKYTMQHDQNYPIVGSLRVANKCAIDLLDVFVIVYGPQGQNVQVTPNKIFQDRLKYNSNIFFEVKLDKNCIDDNGFNIQVCYKTDSITKKKINFKALLPIVQLIRPQFCYQQNFIDSWQIFKNEVYIKPKKLNFKHIRNHQDLKLILPFIHITQPDQNTFSYGIMFKYPKSKTMFMLKISCYINGTASVHLRSDKNGDMKLKEELLNIMNFLFLI